MISKGLLSTQEAADYLGISRQSMHALARRNNMGTQVGRSYVFTQAELDAWLEKPRGVGRPPKSYGRAPGLVVLA